jgi:putative protein-disulfide isomerase
MIPARILWYFADPMCSWCWGFAPVISAIHDAYSERIKIALMLGGLRPGTTESVTASFRAEILHHWQDVHRLTGQPFRFDGAMPDGFVYDTEPPSRAVIVVSELNPREIFPYFISLQEAFYVQQKDITQAKTLAALAAEHHIETDQFLGRFFSEEAKKKTQSNFQITQQAGVRGFPTAVLQNEKSGKLLTNGYRPFEELRPIMDTWLAEA